MKAGIIGVIALIVIGGGAYFVRHKSPSTTRAATSQTQSSGSSTSQGNTQSAPNTITIDGSSFSPASMTVKSGSTVTIKNSSSQDLEFDSDPHPVHTDDTDLNVGSVAPGQSRTFTVTKTGSFGYHDHLDPSIQGHSTVQ